MSEQDVVSLRKDMRGMRLKVSNLETRVDNLDEYLSENPSSGELTQRMGALQEAFDNYRESMASGQARQESRMNGLESRIDELELPMKEEVNMVRIDKKYGMNERGRVCNMQSGREIPEDEPLIVFRAQDRHLSELLGIYAGMCRNEVHAAVAMDILNDVLGWQSKNPTLVKEPDTDLSGYDTPIDDAREFAEGLGLRKSRTAQGVPTPGEKVADILRSQYREPETDDEAQKLASELSEALGDDMEVHVLGLTRDGRLDTEAYARGLLKLAGGEPEDEENQTESERPSFTVRVVGKHNIKHKGIVRTRVDDEGFLILDTLDGGSVIYSTDAWDYSHREHTNA